MAEMNIDKLAILAKAGDEDALRLIYSECKEMLLSKANLYFMVGAERDDVIQEGMIGLFYAIRTFDPGVGASFRAFAELCVKRRIINAIKMASRKKHMPLNESVSIDTALESRDDAGEKEGAVNFEDTLRAPSTADPEEIILLADLLDYVESNARSLFSGMERAVWKAWSHGDSVAEISCKLGKTPKSIDNALTRIKGKIGKLVSLY